MLLKIFVTLLLKACWEGERTVSDIEDIVIVTFKIMELMIVVLVYKVK